MIFWQFFLGFRIAEYFPLHNLLVKKKIQFRFRLDLICISFSNVCFVCTLFEILWCYQATYNATSSEQNSMIKTNVTIKKNMIIYESLIHTATHTYPHQINNEIEDENGCDKIKCSLFFSAFSMLFWWFFSLFLIIEFCVKNKYIFGSHTESTPSFLGKIFSCLIICWLLIRIFVGFIVSMRWQK